MATLRSAASAVQKLQAKATSRGTANTPRDVANELGTIHDALEELDYRIEALELVVSTMTDKLGVTSSRFEGKESASTTRIRQLRRSGLIQ